MRRGSNPNLHLTGGVLSIRLRRTSFYIASTTFKDADINPLRQLTLTATLKQFLVAPTGIEPVNTGYQPMIMPFNYRAIIWCLFMDSNHAPMRYQHIALTK